MSNIIRQWNGDTIRQRDDGYLSATDMCSACGKLFADWNRLASTKEYLKALQEKENEKYYSDKNNTQFIETSPGNLGEMSGTWVHPKIAEELSKWLNKNSNNGKSKTGSVYVYCDAANNAYKIGFTTNLKQRERQHRTSNPFLELVKEYEGKTVDIEQIIHDKLSKFRIPRTTEWYYKKPQVIRIINLVIASV